MGNFFSLSVLRSTCFENFELRVEIVLFRFAESQPASTLPTAARSARVVEPSSGGQCRPSTTRFSFATSTASASSTARQGKAANFADSQNAFRLVTKILPFSILVLFAIVKKWTFNVIRLF